MQMLASQVSGLLSKRGAINLGTLHPSLASEVLMFAPPPPTPPATLFLPQAATAIVLVEGFQSGTKISAGFAITALILMCIYIAGFAWSW